MNADCKGKHMKSKKHITSISKARRGTEEKTSGGPVGTFWEAFWEHFWEFFGTSRGSGARLEENAL